MTKKKVKFTLPPQYVGGATEGMLLGEFNDWNPSEAIRLQKNEDGSMVAELTLTTGKTYEYRYLLSDGRWVNDDAAKTFSQQYGHSVETCVLTVPETVVRKETPKKVVKKENDVITDDLTKIEGINKKVATLLNKEQIRTYKDLSKYTIKKLQLILDGAGAAFNEYDPATWPKHG